MKTIGLSMIVKNEASVIRRCPDSVRPLVDYILIEDTGSTDGTQQIIGDYLKEFEIPGDVFDEEWQDFGTNRTIGLARLRQRADIDYALVMDADDVLVLEDGFDVTAWKRELSKDLYDVAILLPPIRYFRPQLCSNHLDFSYVGVLHEFMKGPEAGFTRATAQGMYIRAGVSGARSGDPEKYRKDAKVLERALATETDPMMRSRYAFYLAQSYRDSAEPEKALQWYLKRSEMGFWNEEVFVSLLSAGQVKERLGHSDSDIIGTYLSAYEICPWRAESLHAATTFCRIKRKFHQGYALGKLALTISQPDNGLFISPWIYEYGLLDDFGVNAYWSGHYAESLEACERLLREGKVPERDRSRIEKNAEFARERLPHTPSRGPVATVLSIGPAGYAHAGAYAELADTVRYGLQQLKFDVRSTANPAHAAGLTVVIGAHCAAATALPPDAIIYNSEHVAALANSGTAYLELLRKHRVWDYSRDNSGKLGALLGKQVQYVPFGFAPELARVPHSAVRDIDVLFYGSVNPRRQAVLDQLRDAGLAVHSVFGVYGEERDALIARAKVVLNMHYYVPGAFEAIRVCYLMANRKAVVTEQNPGEYLDDDLAPGLEAVPYGRLAAACKSLVTDAERRTALQKAAYAAVSGRAEANILRQALAPDLLSAKARGTDAPVQPTISQAELIASYLDLVERCLLNTIYEDPAFDPWSGGSYKPEVRRLGRDWPSMAHTMIGELRLRNFRELIERTIVGGVPGDIIETGVWRGGACIMARAVLKAHQVTDRTVWVADSFEGLPPPDASRYPADDGDRHFEMDQLAVSMEMVQENFRKYGLLDQQVKFLKGWFKDTLPTAPIDKLAVLRLDGDMYQSTMEAITALYDKLQPGGFVIVDDYGAVAGCRQAITDFRVQRDIEDAIIDIDGLGVYWRKT
jgi:glycosyltransferase involved in cell wall biosynthesis